MEPLNREKIRQRSLASQEINPLHPGKSHYNSCAKLSFESITYKYAPTKERRTTLLNIEVTAVAHSLVNERKGTRKTLNEASEKIK